MPVYKIKSLPYLIVFLVVLILIFIPLFLRKGVQDSDFSRTELLMGTLIEIRVKGKDKDILYRALDDAFKEMERLEFVMSHYSDDSEVAKIINRAGIGWVKVSYDLLEVVEESIEVSKLSRGAFDITVGVLGKVWSFGEGKEKVPDSSEVEALLPLVDYREIIINREKNEIMLGREGMRITLGGIGKGYAVERAMGVLKGYGIENAIINAGGDIKVVSEEGAKGWRVGVQDPRREGEMIAAFEVSNTSVATSGDYQRYFIRDGIRYHHILDAKTGFPATGSQSTTVIARNTGLADALSTAVFVLGPEKGMALIERLPDVEGLIVDNKGVVRVSKGLEEKVEIDN
ncbi:MAG: FAD:protein FMN transferase [Thermodesulfobacteriota bacterium]